MFLSRKCASHIYDFLHWLCLFMCLFVQVKHGNVCVPENAASSPREHGFAQQSCLCGASTSTEVTKPTDRHTRKGWISLFLSGGGNTEIYIYICAFSGVFFCITIVRCIYTLIHIPMIPLCYIAGKNRQFKAQHTQIIASDTLTNRR